MNRIQCGALAFALTLGGCAENKEIYLSCKGTEAMEVGQQETEPYAYAQVFILRKTHILGGYDRISSPDLLLNPMGLNVKYIDAEYRADTRNDSAQGGIGETLVFNAVSGRLIYFTTNHEGPIARSYDLACKKTNRID